MQIGYARVSTVGQSLDTQLEQLSHCSTIFKEKISGAEHNRPELTELLNHIKAGDVLVVTKLDRLARSTKDLLFIVDQLEQKKATLQILNMNLDTSTPTGRLMLTMLGAIAEFERTLMLERQAEGIAKAKENGKYKGRFPSARQQAPTALIMLSQGYTKQKIAETLGVSRQSVYRMLK